MRKYTRQTLAERFWSKVDPGTPEECWDWRGAKTGLPTSNHKYGYLGRTPASSLGPMVPAMIASRASWMIHNGSLPSGVHVLHRCDRPICVNPHHLFLGNQADNNRDRSAKGRDGARYLKLQRTGSDNPNSKLSAAQVLDIRTRYASGGVTQIALAEEFGVKQPHISRIVRGVSYLT